MMDTREILLTGGSGQVGRALLGERWPPHLRLVAPARQELDLGRPEALEAWLQRHDFAAILSCAGYTAVDRAERDVAAAWTVNATAPAVLATFARARGIPIVHVSTDYVFDGGKPAAYTEDDAPAPLGVYGASKLGGEVAVRAAAPRHAILRTSWVYGPHGRNFLATMLALGRTRPELRVVDDQCGAPTAAADLAAALRQVTLRLVEDPQAPVGTFHATGAGETTWFGFAQEIFRRAGIAARLTPVTSAQFGAAAPRPANSRLSNDKIAAAYAIRPRPWQDALADVMRHLPPDPPLGERL